MPPIDPEERAARRRRRVLRLALLNGGSVTLLAGTITLVSGLTRSIEGVLVGGAITASGLAELHGRRKLLRNAPDAGRWLAGSQLWFMAVIALYVAIRLTGFSDAEVREALGAADLGALGLEASAPGVVELVRAAYFGVYVVVLLATVVYQGGLYVYYRTRCPAPDARSRH